MKKIIDKSAILRRDYWVQEIKKLSGDFGADFDRLEKELSEEIGNHGTRALVDHLRLCGDIPESYDHDSSEEKLYSKYTDALLSETFKAIGLRSVVLKERADVADVEAFSNHYNFVADAKAFRLSRTAKNQKDFKVQAMDGWRYDKDYAMVVCPIYQLPARSSQIYAQATSRNVCIFTYSHLVMLLSVNNVLGNSSAVTLLHEIFKTVPALNPSKNANSYWLAINKTMLGFDKGIEKLWYEEKQAATESISVAKKEAISFLSHERAKIMKMSHDEALTALIRMNKIENRIEVISSVSDNGILEMV